MSINELKLHEKGILNLFESQQAVAKMISHNKQMGEAHNIKNQDPNIFESKLSQQEYDSIFDNPPTFQEKKAFVEIFRKKWREDKGYCSLFEKLQVYKQAREDGIVKERPRS
jgi:tRNA1(Val) A37 N6-methylase TrmN6